MRDYKHIDQHLNRLYDDIYPQPEDKGHFELTKNVVDYWMSRLTDCRSVLDVGCGEGFAQQFFEGWGASYEGVCLGEDFLQAKKLGRNVRRMDFSFLKHPENSFDLVFSRHSLEHSPMPLITLMEWARVSKNWLGVVVPSPEWYGYKGKNHYYVLNVEQWVNLIECAGWNPIWIRIDEKRFVEGDSGSNKPHEIWIMSEKKR